MRTRVLLAATLLVGLAASAQAATGIQGTKHDMSSATGGAGSVKAVGQDQTCAFCHAPHNAQVNKLLWSRTGTPVAASMKIYTSYNTSSMRSALPQNSLPANSSSLLCLSCHSLPTVGSGAAIVANTANGKGGSSMSRDMSALTSAMDDLTNDHPVGIDYNAARLSSASATASFIVSPTLRLFNTSAGTATMECASCHDVHGSTAGYPKLLAANPAGSALCTACHIK